MAEQSLKDKTVKGVAWSGIDNVVQFGVTFIVSIILARLLSPDDYGLIGIIAIFTTICQTLINAGFSTALVRKKDATDDDFNTVFIVNLGMSLLLYTVIFLCAPLIADFFNRVELVHLTRVSSLSLIIGALAMVQRSRLIKRIDFKSQTKITLAASIVSSVVGISMALQGFGVWALVAQGLTSQALNTILLWVVNKWIPKFRFSYASFQELFGFGWKIMLSGLLNTVWQEIYQVVVGKFYSPATLGQYTRAKGFSQLFSRNLTAVIDRVTFPVLSSIQDDKTRLVPAYRRIIKTTMFVTSICMFTLGAVSEPLLYCLIGSKWHEAATYLPLICINGSLYPLHAINLNMLQVQGRSDLYLGLEIVKKFIGVVPLAVCYFYGIMPMLYVALATGVICYFLNSYFPGKLLGYTSWMQLKDIAPSYTIAIIIAVCVYFLKYIPFSYWIILPLQLVVGIAVFLVVCETTKIEEYMEVRQMFLSLVRKITLFK
jgi:O-antigen/teichoic acid export membrane protein